MGIDKINGFAAMGRQHLNRSEDKTSVEKREDRNYTEEPGTRNETRSAGGDKLEISPKAHRLIALRDAMEQGQQAVDEIPAVRPDRVAEVRSRMERGFYNSVEVRSRVAEQLGEVARNLEDI